MKTISAILAPTITPLKLSATWRGARGCLSLKDALQGPTPHSSVLSESTRRAWHPCVRAVAWRFHWRSLCAGSRGAEAAVQATETVLPLNLLTRTDAVRLLEGQSSLKQPIAEVRASSKAGELPEAFLCPRLQSAGGKSQPEQPPLSQSP